jgi:hypothetical protein
MFGARRMLDGMQQFVTMQPQQSPRIAKHVQALLV